MTIPAFRDRLAASMLNAIVSGYCVVELIAKGGMGYTDGRAYIIMEFLRGEV
ncbi:MAG: hypothetical protein Tsb0020_05110 [Haliangiales bacterium]